MRGATRSAAWLCRTATISTHAPHARRDWKPTASRHAQMSFLLTRLMRGATTDVEASAKQAQISTHAPHARRDPSADFITSYCFISTHAPHARRDNSVRTSSPSTSFLLTRLMRGATEGLSGAVNAIVISTPAPHARRDLHRRIPKRRKSISTHAPHARRDE